MNERDREREEDRHVCMCVLYILQKKFGNFQ